MAMLSRGAGAGVYYDYSAPRNDNAPTFVFINALTGSTDLWQADICPALRKAGYGTLVWNMRGQANSPFADTDTLDEQLIVRDLTALLAEVAPQRPILTGLSIGGLYAAKSWLKGAPAEALVLINTLRRPGLALNWVNEAITRTAALGGQQLVLDLFLPMLVGPAKLSALKQNCLRDQPYIPFSPNDGLMQLLDNARSTDWNVAWDKLTLPVLVLTGMRDRVFLNQDDVDGILDRMPDVQVEEFGDLGHLIPAEDSAATIDALIQFATELEGGR